jgi:hypothetical protein
MASNQHQIRAARGAARLDAKRPGWWRRIRLRRLDMRHGSFDPGLPDSCGCVLAQLDASYAGVERDWYGGDYNRGTERIAEIDSNSSHSAVKYGFFVGKGDESREEWDALTEAWHEQVRERRARARQES